MTDIFELSMQQDSRIYGVGLYETYLFSPHIYMPLVRYSNGRIDNLTMENLKP